MTTIAELRELPIWDIMPGPVKKFLTDAQELGWELHGKGVNIAFRLDRKQDELDLPCYAAWEIGATAKGAVSFRGGRGGMPHQNLSIADLKVYLQDPSTAYPLYDEEAKDEEDLPPWDTSTPVEYIAAALGGTVVEATDSTPSPTSPESSKPTGPALRVTTATAGSPSAALSTGTATPPRPTTRPLRVSAATGVTSTATPGTSSSSTKGSPWPTP